MQAKKTVAKDSADVMDEVCSVARQLSAQLEILDNYQLHCICILLQLGSPAVAGAEAICVFRSDVAGHSCYLQRQFLGSSLAAPRVRQAMIPLACLEICSLVMLES